MILIREWPRPRRVHGAHEVRCCLTSRAFGNERLLRAHASMLSYMTKDPNLHCIGTVGQSQATRRSRTPQTPQGLQPAHGHAASATTCFWTSNTRPSAKHIIHSLNVPVVHPSRLHTSGTAGAAPRSTLHPNRARTPPPPIARPCPPIRKRRRRRLLVQVLSLDPRGRVATELLLEPAVRVLARRRGPRDARGGEEVGEGGYAGEGGDELSRVSFPRGLLRCQAEPSMAVRIRHCCWQTVCAARHP